MIADRFLQKHYETYWLTIWEEFTTLIYYFILDKRFL